MTLKGKALEDFDKGQKQGHVDGYMKVGMKREDSVLRINAHPKVLTTEEALKNQVDKMDLAS